MGKMILDPGTLDNDNRDYLPEKIKGSDVVVNENGNNSRPYPKRLQQFNGVICDEVEDEWYIYVPSSYDARSAVPLIVSLHGGMMTGWGQCIYTSWTIAAERDGFICLFPNASKDRFWCTQWGQFELGLGPDKIKQAPEELSISPENPMENHDVKMVLGLIKKMRKDYNIDSGRIFLQGMSMGDMMTGLFAREIPDVFAGVAGSGAASFLTLLFTEDYKLKGNKTPLAVWQSRPELNGIPAKGMVELNLNKYNRLYWNYINQCSLLPQIKIHGDDNFAFYHGEKADMVFYDIKNRDHGQTFHDAALIWDYLFSGVRRQEDGSLLFTKPFRERKGDTFAIAVAAGCKRAWTNNQVMDMNGVCEKRNKMKYHGLDGGQLVRGTYHMVPLSFISEIYDAKLDYSKDKRTAFVHLKDGRCLQFASGSIGCVIDQSLVQMYIECISNEDELLISVEWFSEYVENMHVSECDDVVYVTDHVNHLSYNMAYLIKDILSDNMAPDDYPDWK